MVRRPRRAPALRGTVLLVATDPAVIAAAEDAARRLDSPPPIAMTATEALRQLVGPGEAPRHLVLESGGEASQALLKTARDPFGRTGVVVVARPGLPAPDGLRAVPAEGASLAAALRGADLPEDLPPGDGAALAEGLGRGEITVRFQPMVRLADRQPVMVEALARWERPDAPLSPNDFIPMAERAGLSRQLTMAVARRAVTELGLHRRRLRLSFNVPLSELLKPELGAWLGRLVKRMGMPPRDLLLELTESTEVRDTALLRRALRRLRDRGFGVLLDDLGLNDRRRLLLSLPFAGVKLDRRLVVAMPHSRRARAEVESIVRHARRDGLVVIAEGVTDTYIWRAVTAAGCDLAQGFGVGRPLVPAALGAWSRAWRAAAVAQPR